MSSDKPDTSTRRRRIAGERPATKRQDDPSLGLRRSADSRRKPGRNGADRRGPNDGSSSSAWRPSHQTLMWFVPLCVLAVVATGLAIGLGILEQRTEDDVAAAAAREDAVAPAGQATEALLSFRYDTLDEELRSEQDLMTDSYADEFLEVFPDEAMDLTTEAQATVESTVLAAAPLECGEECSSGLVEVLVYVNTESAVAGQSPEVSPNRAVVTMQREGDAWLVGGIELF
jgi:Mce-associated membrane protein